MKKSFVSLSFFLVTIVSCTFEKPESSTASCDAIIHYSTDIVPIIQSNCVSCHFAGATCNSIPCDYTTYEGLKAKVDDGKLKERVVKLKNMPEPPNTMSDANRNKINCWIQQGAKNN